jgi:hypothetical protein
MSKNVAPEELEAAMLALLTQKGEGRTIGPSEVAQAVGGKKPEGWGPLMKPVRQEAVRLMKEGRVVILRKGEPVDPDSFKGTYRLALPTAPDA